MDRNKTPTKQQDDDSLTIPSRSIVGRDVVPKAGAPSTSHPALDAPESITPDTPEPDTDAAAATPKPADKEATQAAVQRERELQEYMRNHEYFVPIDPADRRRSVKISFGLIVVLLLLAFVLVDLLLDSGTILLLQKIPHTHFFGLQE